MNKEVLKTSSGSVAQLVEHTPDKGEGGSSSLPRPKSECIKLKR